MPFETSDLGLVAALDVYGLKPIGIRTDNKRVVFQFDDDRNLQELKTNYFDGYLKVTAMAYFYALKQVKNSIYNKLK